MLLICNMINICCPVRMARVRATVVSAAAERGLVSKYQAYYALGMCAIIASVLLMCVVVFKCLGQMSWEMFG